MITEARIPRPIPAQVLYPEVSGYAPAFIAPAVFEVVLPENECFPAVILLASRQKDKVERLVQYCRRLDGTELNVVVLPPEIDQVPHPLGAELAIRYAARRFSNTPWLYLEVDSIPLKPHFRSTLTQEYRRANRLFMLPSLDGLSQHDLACGIGIWPAEAASILPATCTAMPFFDQWLYLNQARQLHLTTRIQHSYGRYGTEHDRVLHYWEFPADKSILRPDAVIFHADKTQSIIEWSSQLAFYSTGDLGDIIAALPVIKQQGGGKLYLGPNHIGTGTREVMTHARFESIRPLLEAQPYLLEVGFMPQFDKAKIDRDLSTFRASGRTEKDNLATWQARHVGRLNLNLDPWLTVGEAPWHGRVICSRSLRYRNPDFPWALVIRKYGDKIGFVGTNEEYADFQQFGKVERLEAKDVLELARIIKGAELQYSNQSLPWWIGAGLGKLVIQETWSTGDQNSIIERPGLNYTRTDSELAVLRRLLQ
jgi:hypothetical protein